MNKPESILAAQASQERTSAFLRTAIQPMPLLAGLTAAGLAVIYAMGEFRILEPLGWQALVAVFMLLLAAAAIRAIAGLANRGRGWWAFSAFSIATAVAGNVFALLFQGAAPLAILMSWIAPTTFFTARIPRPRYTASVGMSIAASVLVLWWANHPILPRVSSGTTSGFAALMLLTSMVILFVMLTIATQVIRYRALQTRLVASLIPVLAVAIVFTTSIAAFNALTSNQQQLVNSLEAVTSLKRSQLDSLIRTIFSELGAIQQGSAEAGSIMHLLERPGASDDEYRLNASVAATQIRNVIVLHPASDYEEILVLDNDGMVVLATYILDQGSSFQDQAFFQQALTAPAAQFIRFPGKQNAAAEYKLVASAPFYGATPNDVLGVVVGVASGDTVLGIMEPTAGLENVDTYVVDKDLRPTTRMSSPSDVVHAEQIAAVVRGESGSGSGSYANYAGTPVLGYYDWDPALQAAIVAEVPQSVAAGRALAALLASALVGLLTVIIAGIAVVSTSRAISEPVSGLAEVADRLATGHLTARAPTDREDEIGRLAGSFNTMANQLQTVIGDLEKRVADRTSELELQVLRLRTAAEIARDSALAQSVGEILSRAARLVLERFNATHVGIYLLDEDRQYAVLQAAPSAAGQRLLAQNYRVLVADQGAVSQVAATGEPLLVVQGAVDTLGTDSQREPSTQVQLSLPLRTNEGTIGVLDLQSDSPTMFGPSDTAIIQVLADQLAASIERSRLLLQVQERLGQVEDSYRRFTEKSWNAFGESGQALTGYRYDNVRLDPVLAIPAEARRALETGATLVTETSEAGVDGGRSAFIPIRLRGQTLGVICANFRQAEAPAGTMAMLQQAADRLGTALENVRLLEDSLRRAGKERLIGEISARISSSISVRNVLQTAVEELGRALPGSDVSIKFRSNRVEADKDSPS